MQKVLELLLLSSTALAVIGDGFIALPVHKLQAGEGSAHFPNRLPIFDVVNGVAKSVEDDVNQIIQPIFGNGIFSGGSIQGTHSGNGHSVKYEVSLPSSSSQKGSNGPSSTDNKDTDPSKTGFSLDDLMNSIPTDFWNLIGLNKPPTSSDNGSKDADFTPSAVSQVEQPTSKSVESTAPGSASSTSSSSSLEAASSSQPSEDSQPSSSANKKTGAFFLSLDNTQTLYTATLKVGSPAQEVQVMIDTGSSDLWFISSGNSQCKVNGGSIDCDKYGVFDKLKSSTWHDNKTDYSISYYDGDKASGTMGQDNITFADGFLIENANFAVIDNTTSSIGVFGVGYPELEAVKSKYTNLPFAMKEQNLIAKVAYSLYLDSRDAVQGYILFGGIDHAKYTGDLKAFDIVQSNDKYVYSQIPLTSVASSLNNYTNAYGLPAGSNHPKVGAVIYNGTDSFNGGVDLKDTPTLLDTGTTYSYLSKDQVESIVGLYGNVTYNDAGKAYEVPCWVGNPGNYLEFNFKNEQYIKVPTSEFVISVGTYASGAELCVFGILPGTHSILGDNFMRSVYAVFDLEDHVISIAQAAYNDNHAVVPIE